MVFSCVPFGFFQYKKMTIIFSIWNFYKFFVIICRMYNVDYEFKICGMYNVRVIKHAQCNVIMDTI